MIDSRNAVMRGLASALGLALLMVLAVMLASERSEAASITFQAEGTGETYARHCAPCHGPAGEGSDYGPALAGSQLPVEDRTAIITNGSSAMPAFGPTLSPDQIAQLASLNDPLFAGGLYLQQCGPCHGVEGEGGVGNSLQASTMTDGERLAIIRDGSLIMPAFGPTLTPEQIDGLVSFVANIAADAATPADAAAVYAERCASCHGDDGGGGAGPSLQDSTTSLADQTAIIREGRGGMPAYGSTLSAEELDAVAAYSAALQAAPPDTSPVEQGAQVYADHCSGCHGVEGLGGIGPNLKTTTLSRDDLAEAVTQGQGTMPGFAGQLSPDDIEALVTFLEDLASEEPPGPSLLIQGAELFTGNCARCHGPDASGGVGPALKNSTLTDVEMASVISNGGGAMPAFAGILTSADTTALVAYVDSTRTADSGSGPLDAVSHGREIFVSSCATCHGLDARGGVGPTLAGTRLTANEIISQVFGIHADRMPAFEGLLDAAQVQDVARYLLTIEGEPTSQIGWLVAGVLVVVAAMGAAVLWYGGFLDQLFRRSR